MSANSWDEATGTPSSALRAATTLALWSAAVAGGESADAAIDAFAATGMRRGARAATTRPPSAKSWSLPGPGEAHSGHAELLAFVRRGGPAALVLPVPGDVRGLPPGGAIVSPAVEAGAVVVLPDHGAGLVPVDGHWRAYPCGPAHRALSEHDARRLVDDAMREATVALARADVARGAGDPRDRVRRMIVAEEVALPPGTPRAAAALLAQSITLHALLMVAGTHETAAVTARDLGAVSDALVPLAAAVRESRRTAVEIAVTALHPAAATADRVSAPRTPSRRQAR